LASVNKVILVGRLGKDPETRSMPNGDAVTSITLATSETWKDKSGEKQEKTEWHRLTFYRKLAEIAAQYLKKGSLIYAEGRLETRKWTDKAGVEKFTTEIIVNEMVMLGGNKSTGAAAPPPADTPPSDDDLPPPGASKPRNDFSSFEDDIPFSKVKMLDGIPFHNDGAPRW